VRNVLVRLILSLGLPIGLLMMCAPISAHHGTSNYDQGKTISLAGVVTEFVWSNPHAYLLFDVKDEKGTIVHWVGEMNSPTVLARTGWTRTTLKKGDQVKLTLRASVGGNPVGLISRSTVAVNGKLVESGQP
jgi:hypothetical protein